MNWHLLRIAERHGPKAGDWLRDLNYSLGEVRRRDVFIRHLGFAVPTREAIEAIIKHVGGRQLVEVGAGAGLWACLLHDAGVDVVAYDNWAWHGNGRRRVSVGKFFPVERGTQRKALSREGHREVLMLIWPPYSEGLAHNAVRNFRGDRFIYIGEGDGGCTGCDRFHALLERDWELTEEVAIPQWWGIHDSVYLYERAGVKKEE